MNKGFNIKHIFSREEPGTGRLTTTYKTSELATSILSREMYREVANTIAQKVAEEIYSDVMAQLDQELIVKETSLRVSENILAKIFGDRDGKTDGND